MALSTRKRKFAIITILNELNADDDDDEPVHIPPRGPDRVWIREREKKGAFANIFKDLELSDEAGFRHFRHFRFFLRTLRLRQFTSALRFDSRFDIVVFFRHLASFSSTF